MPVIAFRLNKIEGKRNDDVALEGSLEVRSNFKILSVKKVENDTLRVNFDFEVEYNPDVGKIEFEGYLLYQNSNITEVIKEEDERSLTLKEDVIREISTVIIRESLIESVSVAKQLRLPVPIKLPRVSSEIPRLRFAKAS
ncbi:MAG: hypothetical protein DRO65_02670 [Candidatus Altiarchaeales archaeon]|nr:MAG: hypothetical protein DRO65_02670 [Candidatus Altiarchaeales archaeon]